MVSSSVAATMERSTKLLLPLASRFNLSVTSFGKNVTDPSLASYGSLSLSDAFDGQLEPAPITPTDSAAYKLLSGTILATHQASSDYKQLGKEMTIAPGMMTGIPLFISSQNQHSPKLPLGNTGKKATSTICVD